MRPVFLLVFALTAATSFAGDIVPDWVTVSGRHYRNAEVVSLTPESISIRHEDGVVRIPFSDLTPQQKAAYQLNEDKRATYVKEQQEKAKLARDQAELRAEEERLNPTPKKAPKGNYYTAEAIKSDWLRTVSAPNKLDRDYTSKFRSYQDYVRSIQDGSRDRDAEKKAAQLNLAEAKRVGDDGRAKQERRALARIEKEQQQIAREDADRERQREAEEASREAAAQAIADSYAQGYDSAYQDRRYDDCDSSGYHHNSGAVTTPVVPVQPSPGSPSTGSTTPMAPGTPNWSDIPRPILPGAK